MSFEFLEHVADVKFRASGGSLEEMFSEAAFALFDVIRGDIKILETNEKEFEIEGEDLENLLYNFLEEFLYMLDAEDFLVSGFRELKIEKGENFRIVGRVVGDRATNYKFTNDVKAITYSGMYVREEEGKFCCQVVLDV